MTSRRPGPACVEVAFGTAYAVGASGQVALEDYARALTRAEAAETIPSPGDPGRVAGLHVCAPAEPPRRALVEDMEAFAREMAERGGEGLGWS